MVGSSLMLLSPSYGPTFHFNGLSIRVIIVPLGGVPSSRELGVRGRADENKNKMAATSLLRRIVIGRPAAGPGCRRDRYRNPHRQYHAVHRPAGGVRFDRQGGGRLFRDD